MVLDLEPRHLDMVRRILARHAPDVRAWAFGSWTACHAGRFSDLDVVLEAENGGGVPIETLARLRDAFSESDLPIKVDVVDWAALDPEFRSAIEPRRVPL
jgi:type I restriction enzyme S subunit